MVDWILAVLASTSHSSAERSVSAEWLKNFNTILDYSAGMQVVKREHPGGSILTALSACVDNGDISQGKFLQWMFLNMTAGFETTHTAISQSMHMYLTDPEARALTDRAMDEGSLDRAVEEYVPIISPLFQMARTATKDTEAAGQHIRTNDVMVLYYTSANRGTAIFSDPDPFDPWRADQKTLAFGSGVHRCLGSTWPSSRYRSCGRSCGRPASCCGQRSGLARVVGLHQRNARLPVAKV